MGTNFSNQYFKLSSSSSSYNLSLSLDMYDVWMKKKFGAVQGNEKPQSH
jgi:hypothetical protein